MRVHLGSDHAGFELKERLVQRLTELGHEPVDHGAAEYDAVDDYPPFVLRAAEGVAKDPGSLGIVIGGSGNGEAIAANKVRGARCARPDRRCCHCRWCSRLFPGCVQIRRARR